MDPLTQSGGTDTDDRPPPLRIGLTYDLRSEYLAAGYGEEETAELDKEETIEAIESTLARLGHMPERIGNAKQLVALLLEGRRWDLVFNIAEGLHGTGREAQVPAILDLYQIPYTFSDPLTLSLTLHKGMAKRVVRDAEIPTPDFLVVGRAKDLETLDFDGPWFAKPLAEGTSKGIGRTSQAQTRDELTSVCTHLLQTFKQPVLVEEYLPGREFTVGILGTGDEATVAAVMEVVFLATDADYPYDLKAGEWKGKVDYVLRDPTADPLFAETARVALAAWQVLGCRDAGRVDIRCDRNGQPCFIEANPLAGLTPDYSDLPIACGLAGIPYDALIDRIVCSAATRVDLTRRAPPPPAKVTGRRVPKARSPRAVAPNGRTASRRRRTPEHGTPIVAAE